MSKIIIDREELDRVEWQDLHHQKQEHTGKRRLLITTDNFLPRWDGISRFLAEIIPRLKSSYDITIVAPDYGPVAIDQVEIVQIPIHRKSYGDYQPSHFAYRKILALMRRTDIVFNQALGPIGVSAILAAKRAHRPIVSYIHSIEWELLPKALQGTVGPIWGSFLPLSKSVVRFFYNRCTVLITPSEHVAELFSWQRITTPKRIAHLGVDTVKFSTTDKRHARQNLNIPDEAFVIGYHGRIGHEKNLITLLHGFRRLQIPHKRLLIVGGGVPEIVKKLSQSSGVTVTGSSDNVVPYLQAMDVYVQPSLTETTSLTVLEAMACSLPVVSSKVGFIKQYIKDGRNGLFFDNRSPFDLSVKLKKLHDDRVLRTSLGIEARRTVVERFNWEKTATDIKAVLDEM